MEFRALQNAGPEHDFSLLNPGSEKSIIVLSPHFFIMSISGRHLPAVNALTAIRAADGTEIGRAAQAEVFSIQKELYRVFTEAFGVRPARVQPLILQMSGDLFHVQYWPRYKEPVTILGREFVDIDFSNKQVATRPVTDAQRENAEFLDVRAEEIRQLLRASFLKFSDS